MGRTERLQDEKYMRMALSLAFRGTGCVSPNPRVGCVLVREGVVVGWGFHGRYGGPHAETEALKVAGDKALGATAYVTLEPCSHFGKTPPCADALVRAGVRRVVVGVRDPNPKVDGGGMRRLREADVHCVEGVLEEACREINRGFFRVLEAGRPWITAKGACSWDGMLALADGQSRWITNERSRRVAHVLRREHDAVLVGIGTVLADDPALTVRGASGVSPRPVVLDTALRLPENAALPRDKRALIFCGPEVPEERRDVLRRRGAEVVAVSQKSPGRLDLEEVLTALVQRGVLSLLLEGGSATLGAFFQQRLVDAVALFLAPKLLGCGLPFSGELSFRAMDEVLVLGASTWTPLGDDVLLEGRLSCLRAS